MYKKCYELLNSLSEYAKENKKFQDILFSKYKYLEGKKRRAKIAMPIQIIFLVAVYTFILIQVVYYSDFDNIIEILISGDFLLHLFLIVVEMVFVSEFHKKFLPMLTFGYRNLLDGRDLKYINRVLKEETNTLHNTNFKYISSHEISVSFLGKEHILDTDTINFDEDCKSICIQTNLQVVKGKLKTVVEVSDQNR